MMKKLTLRQGCLLILLAFLATGVIFYAIAHQQLTYKTTLDTGVSAENNVGELVAETTLEQDFSVYGETLSRVSVLFQNYGRANTGTLEILLLNEETVLYTEQIDVSTLIDNAYFEIYPNLSEVNGKILTLRVTSLDGIPGNAITVAYGTGVAVGRGSVAVEIGLPLRLNDAPVEGQLCMKTTAIETLWFGQYYWYFLTAVLALVGIYFLRLCRYAKTGQGCLGLKFLNAIHRYRFLLQQLVDRDFKTKYKRSILGVFWSFLNPLLTMLVQYLVFSTLFRSDLPNYPVYLLSGIVCFNYFSESIGQCMISITGNAGLITKVYVPKYIYPLSKTLSSGINLLLSLIPLVVVMLLTGLRPTPTFLLLPFGLACLFAFCLGMGMLLATSMVFFRDTQFLWGVVNMLWMYCTPIFYPENIIPDHLMPVFKMNPLYHIIRFCRSVLIDSVSPEPKAYLFCLIASIVPLLLGTWVFKRYQNKFILHI